MGERKVLNKYYPPDFDPAKITRKKQPKNQQIGVRMMLPMKICCDTCKSYIDKGKKFNSRKENVEGETYLGIQIFRFYFKCFCSAEITMKTDPKNSDYILEFGASRNFEPWRAEDEEANEVKRKRESEERGDDMKSLENRTLDSKREMDERARLDELQSMKSRHACVNPDDLLAKLPRRLGEEKENVLHADDEAIIKSIYQGNENVIRRIDDEEFDADEDLLYQANDNEKSINCNTKRRKVAVELGKPTDSLTGRDTVVTASKKPRPMTVTVRVVKKPSPVPTHVPRNCSTNSNVREQSAVLEGLGKSYDSDED